MSEFKQNAPKYEGMDKNVALAKIFFSIAAGKDPDAITNIAQGLEKGADMFIKDKAKRDDFNRQVDLASLRYGLQERSKDRKLKYFIADKDVTVDGKKYEKGSVVDLTEGFIRKNGIPAGLSTETLTKAAMDNTASIKKALAKAAKDKQITNKDFIALGKQVTDATDTFTKSRNLQTLIQGQIFQVADGKVTGITPAANDLVSPSIAPLEDDTELWNGIPNFTATVLNITILGFFAAWILGSTFCKISTHPITLILKSSRNTDDFKPLKGLKLIVPGK